MSIERIEIICKRYFFPIRSRFMHACNKNPKKSLLFSDVQFAERKNLFPIILIFLGPFGPTGFIRGWSFLLCFTFNFIYHILTFLKSWGNSNKIYQRDITLSFLITSNHNDKKLQSQIVCESFFVLVFIFKFVLYWN